MVVDDCVPDLDKTANAKKFVKAYEAHYGYVPNYASAQVYDAFHMAANAVEKAMQPARPKLRLVGGGKS